MNTTNDRATALTTEQLTKEWRFANAKDLVKQAISDAGFKAYTTLPEAFEYAHGTTETNIKLWEEIVAPQVSRKELLTIAYVACVPRTKSYITFNMVAERIGMKVLPNVINEERTTDKQRVGVGTILLDRLHTNNLIELSAAKVAIPGSEYKASTLTVDIDWETKFGSAVFKAIESTFTGCSVQPSENPQPVLTSRPKLGYSTNALRKSISKANLKLSRFTLDAIQHRGSVALSIYDFNGDEDTFNEFLARYLNLMDKRILTTQQSLNLAASLDDSLEIRTLQAFNRKQFIRDINRLRVLGKYYVFATTDERTRAYDASSFGFQADKFIRHLIRFANSKAMTTEGESITREYMKHLEHEIPKLATGSIKEQIESLGLEVKLVQLQQDLDNNTMNTPLEYDGKNSGIQCYATAALKSLNVGRYGGLDPKAELDAYRALVDWVNTTYCMDIEVKLVRNDGKRPVMVFIYGAGKQTIMTKGGDGWKGLRTLLIEAKVPNLPSESELFAKFQEFMASMLPGVTKAMNMALRNHSSRRGTKLEDSVVRYQWNSILGDRCQLLLEQHGVKSVIKIPLTNERTYEGNVKSITHVSTILNPNVKTQALAPLPIHSVDAPILYMVIDYFASFGLDIGTVHDGFFVRAGDVPTLFLAYKLALVRVNDSDIYAEMMSDLNPSITSQLEWESEVANNIQILKNYAANTPDFELLTTEHIMASTPLSF